MAVVEFSVADGIAIIRLNRPQRMNAITPEGLVRMQEYWIEVRDNPAIRVAILTGTGERAFCAGADLGELIPLLSGARPPENAFDRALLADPDLPGRATLRTMDVEKPVIAAVNGFAVAGGMEMLQGTDLRIASSTAQFGLKEVQRGLVANGGSCVRLPRQIPYVHAMEILLTGENFSAQRALEIGFVNYVVPPDELMPRAIAMAERVAANGPLAVKLTRQIVRACLGRPESEVLPIEWEMGNRIYETHDAREGPLAFMEKRPPRFESR